MNFSSLAYGHEAIVDDVSRAVHGFVRALLFPKLLRMKYVTRTYSALGAKRIVQQLKKTLNYGNFDSIGTSP